MTYINYGLYIEPQKQPAITCRDPNHEYVEMPFQSYNMAMIWDAKEKRWVWVKLEFLKNKK